MWGIITVLILIVIGWHIVVHEVKNKAGYDWSPTIDLSALNNSLSNLNNVNPTQVITSLNSGLQDSINAINLSISNATGIPLKMLSDSKIPGAPVIADGFKILGGPLMTIAQIIFVDENDNILQFGNFKNIKASSTYRPFTAPENALDTNIYFLGYPHVWHPSGSDTYAWLSADFDSPKKIKRIVIYNREDCCQDRINGAHFSLLSGGDIIFNKNLDVSQFTKNVLTINLA